MLESSFFTVLSGEFGPGFYLTFDRFVMEFVIVPNNVAIV